MKNYVLGILSAVLIAGICGAVVQDRNRGLSMSTFTLILKTLQCNYSLILRPLPCQRKKEYFSRLLVSSRKMDGVLSQWMTWDL